MLRRHGLFSTNDSGNTALLFAIALIPLGVVTGAGMDYGRAMRADQIMQNAADVAALAAVAGKSLTQAQAEQIVLEYVKANGGTELVDGNGEIKVTLDQGSGKVSVTVDAEVETGLMSLANIDTIGVRGYSEAIGGSAGVEMVLVLDSTESMNDFGKIGALKVASKKLITEMFDSANDPNDVRIGIVPFSQYVNVGVANRNKSWMNVPSDTTQSFTKTFTDKKYKNCKKRDETWYRDGVPYIQKDVQYDCEDDGETVETRTWTDHWNWLGCVGSRKGYDTVITGTGLDPYSGIMQYGYNGPSTSPSCPVPVQELTSDKAKLNQEIDKLTPVGDTYMPSGIVWGWNVLDPDEPFTFTPRANGDPKRAMLIMTDGLNSMEPDYPSHRGVSPPPALVANQKTAELCENVKATGVIIYTVAFKVSDSVTLKLLGDCATSSETAYDADNKQALIDSFTEIAKNIAAIRLAK
jgi:Flp pilus assembly protein TadG